MKLFLKSQPVLPNIVPAPRIFRIDTLQARIVKTRTKKIRQEHFPHRSRQVVPCDRARLDTGRHQVDESLHLAVLDQHVCVDGHVFERGEVAQRANIAGFTGAGGELERVKGWARVLEEGADGVEAPSGAVSDIAEGV